MRKSLVAATREFRRHLMEPTLWLSDSWVVSPTWLVLVNLVMGNALAGLMTGISVQLIFDSPFSPSVGPRSWLERHSSHRHLSALLP